MRRFLPGLCCALLLVACRPGQKDPARHTPSSASGTQAFNAPSPPPVSPPLPADCPSVERVGAGVTEPVEVSRAQPKYPDTSGHRFSSTLFILEATIDRNGVVHDVHMLREPKITPPLPAFGAAIVDAISSWRYKPATLHGQPVCVYLTVTVSIHLR